MRVTIVNNDTINHNWGIDVLSPAAFNVRASTIRGVGNTTSVEFVAGIPASSSIIAMFAGIGSLDWKAI
ncbi:MAG: hypothetical protein HY619_05600 [Thaumarchaeota archaeon]|nr:hypothetical protein [Nitrososphaerota archaeon]